MKINHLFLLVAILCLVIVNSVAQTVPPDVAPPELATTPFQEWTWNLTTVYVVTSILGRAFAALRKGGGIKGIVSGIWFGTNTPPK